MVATGGTAIKPSAWITCTPSTKGKPTNSGLKCAVYSSPPNLPSLTCPKRGIGGYQILSKSNTKNNDVLVVAQDKVRAIALEDPEAYESKMFKKLDPPDIAEDAKTYVKLSKGTSKDIKTKVTQKLKSLKDDGKISYKQYMKTEPQS